MKWNGRFLRTRAGALCAAAAIAIAVIVLICGLVGVSFLAQAKAMVAAENELAHVRAEASARNILRKQLQELRARTSGTVGLLHGTSLAAAQTELQQRVESSAKIPGISIRSTQMMPSQRDGGFEVVEIQYELVAPMSKLADLMYAVENQIPFTFLRNVQIASGGAWQADVPAANDVPLNIQWTLRGYRWGMTR